MSSYLKSQPIKIFAGQDKQLFYVHTSLLSSSESTYLQQLVNGDWKECEDQRIEWLDHDSQTVGQVLEYLYNGDYNIPDNETCHEKTLNTSHGDSLEDCEDNPVAIKQPEHLCTIEDLRVDVSDLGAASPMETNLDPNAKALIAVDSHGTSILTHAKVYTFAQYLHLLDLEKLALARLIESFSDTKIVSQTMVITVLNTIRHIYENTAERANKEPARNAIARFTAHNYFKLSKELKQLIFEGGDFVSDLFENLEEILLGAEQKVDQLTCEVQEHKSRIAAVKQVIEGYDLGSAKVRTIIRQIRQALSSEAVTTDHGVVGSGT